MRSKRDNRDARAARVAAGRHGVLRSDHLAACGFDRAAIRRRVLSGLLHPKYRRVYAWGHAALSLEGRWLAAVDAYVPRSFLSHLAAACLWGLLIWDDDWPIDVTVSGASGRARHTGIRLHRTSTLQPRHTTERAGIPVTNLRRLLPDVKRAESARLYREVLRQAEIKGHRLVLPADHVPNRSDLELAMHSLCTRHRLPLPRTRVPMGGGYEADFLFEPELMIVETDGRQTHGIPSAFEYDRERDVDLMLRGYQVVHFTYDQVMKRPAEVARRLRRLLAARRALLGLDRPS